MSNETTRGSGIVISSPPADLVEAMDDREFRSSYMAHHLRAFLADQIRNLRGSRSQKAFGALIGKPQSVISRLEDEDYGKVALQSLIDIAGKLDVALLVRYVDFPTFLAVTRDFSQYAVAPPGYGLEAMAGNIAPTNAATGALAAFTAPSSQARSSGKLEALIRQSPVAAQSPRQGPLGSSLPSVPINSVLRFEGRQEPDPETAPGTPTRHLDPTSESRAGWAPGGAPGRQAA